MLIDGHNEFSNAQAITVTDDSEDIWDTETDFIGAGRPLPIHAAVTTTFTAAGAGTLTISLQSSDAEAFGTYTTHWVTDALAVAALVAGYQVELPPIPENTDRYVRLYYTVTTGPFTAGNFDAAVVLDKQTNDYDKISFFGGL